VSPLAAVQIANSLETALTDLPSFLPKLIGFLVILVVGYIVARIVKSVVIRLQLDRRLHESPAGNYVERFSPGASPARLVGAVRRLRPDDSEGRALRIAGDGYPPQLVYVHRLRERRAAQLPRRGGCRIRIFDGDVRLPVRRDRIVWKRHEASDAGIAPVEDPVAAVFGSHRTDRPPACRPRRSPSRSCPRAP